MTHVTAAHDLAIEYWRRSNRHVKGPSIQFALEMLDLTRAAETIAGLRRAVPFPIAGCRVLEIGCGVGASQLAGRREGLEMVGIEPSFLGARAGGALFAEHGRRDAAIVCGVGEHLPFGDGTFDVVCSFQVFEHVRNPAFVLAETSRVLRRGGAFVHIFPNYGSCWEGHYGVPWVPFLPKSLGRLYLRALGQDLSMLEELQLVNYLSVSALLRSHPELTVVDWGQDVWEQRVRTLAFSEWAYLGRLKRMVRLVHALGLTGALVWLGRRLHLETPIILVGLKQ